VCVWKHAPVAHENENEMKWKTRRGQKREVTRELDPGQAARKMRRLSKSS